MAQPGDMILESQEHAYFTHFRSQDLKFSDTKSSFLVTFLLPHPSHPRSAVMKVYRKANNPIGLLEAQHLTAASSITPLSQRCYYSFQHQGEVYLFVEHCPRGSLKDKIKRRNGAKLWSEQKLLCLFETLAGVLDRLHTQSSLHVTLKARHVRFTEAKEIRIGGFAVKNTPKSDLIDNEKNSEKSVQGDVKRLCATFFETAACRLTPKSGSIEPMKNTIQASYSDSMVAFLLSSVTSPPTSSHALLQSLSGVKVGRVSVGRPVAQLCEGCARYFASCVTLQCGHGYCDECIVARLVAASETPGEVSCAHCGKRWGLAVIETCLPLASEDVRKAYIQWTQSQLTGQCDYCSAEFPILKRKKGALRPYDLKCTCKRRFCSYCHLRGGHKLVVFPRACYVFEQSALNLP